MLSHKELNAAREDRDKAITTVTKLKEGISKLNGLKEEWEKALNEMTASCNKAREETNSKSGERKDQERAHKQQLEAATEAATLAQKVEDETKGELEAAKNEIERLEAESASKTVAHEMAVQDMVGERYFALQQVRKL